MIATCETIDAATKKNYNIGQQKKKEEKKKKKKKKETGVLNQFYSRETSLFYLLLVCIKAAKR